MVTAAAPQLVAQGHLQAALQHFCSLLAPGARSANLKARSLAAIEKASLFWLLTLL